MSECQKRIIITRFWIDDIVYHKVTGAKGLVTSAQIIGDKFLVRYFVSFSDANQTGWFEEMELSDQKVIN